MTLRFSCSGRCQDRVGRTGEWKKVVDVDSPRLISAFRSVCLCVLDNDVGQVLNADLIL